MKPKSETNPHSPTKLAIGLAFIGVLLIWTTTPLAIAKSVGSTPFTSALARMAIGALFCLAVLSLRGKRLSLGRETVWPYLIGGLSIFFTMGLIYKAAHAIPSGWIAVLFGLSPLITGVMSIPFEPSAKLTGLKTAGLCLGVIGLYQIFAAGESLQDVPTWSIGLTLLAVVIAGASAVAMRHLTQHRTISGMELSTGGLLVATPLFAIAALTLEPVSQVQFTTTELATIAYLGLIGSGIGFTLYYFLLKQMSASRVALITLITPITSLALGAYLNNEPLLPSVWIGAACVSIGLLLYEFKPKLGWRRL